MHRGKRPVHSQRGKSSSRGGATGSRGGSSRGGGRGGRGGGRGGRGDSESKRPRFEDSEKPQRDKPKAVSFSAPRARPGSPGLSTAPTPVDKGKKPSRADAAEPVARSSTFTPPTSFKIIAGCYEKILYGLDGAFPSVSPRQIEKSTAAAVPVLTPIFIFPAHVSCVKAVAASPEGGKWLATGSTDEIIKVWDLRRRKEIGGLMQHTGTIHPLSIVA